MRCAVLFIAAGLAHAQTYVSDTVEMETSYGMYDRALAGSAGASASASGIGSGGSYATTAAPTTAAPTTAASTTAAPTTAAPTTAAPTTAAPTTAAPAPAPKVTFNTGLGGINKANFEKPAVQLAYKEKIAAEINKQSTEHGHAHRRRLAAGGVKAEDIEIKNIVDDGNGGIKFDVEITVKTTSGEGTDVAALATEVQNRANNLIEKIKDDKTFASTFKTELRQAIETAAPGSITDTNAFDNFDIGAATTEAKATGAKKHSDGGSGAAIGGAVAAVLVVGAAAFMYWKKKQGGGGSTVTPTN